MQYFNEGDHGRRRLSSAGSYGEMQRPVDVPQRIRLFQADKEIFGQELETTLSSVYLPRAHAFLDFVPIVRAVRDIFDEDENSADVYATAVAEDDEIYVEGLQGNLIRIDKWDEAEFPDALMENIQRAKYIKPRQIQRAAIPIILDRYDVVAHSETGSGKTAAFLLPIISECMDSKKEGSFTSKADTPFAVILGPSRELIKQCAEQAFKFADGTDVSVAKAYGEYPVRRNKDEISRGCDILCSTPGRLKHFLEEGFLNLTRIRFIVFDEGDRLLDRSFMSEIRPIIEHPLFPKKTRRQTLFFSATISDEMREVAKEFTREDACAFISNRRNGANKKCIQEFRAFKNNEKFVALVDYFRDEVKKVDNDPSKLPRTLVFCNYRDHVEKLAVALGFYNILCIPLTGLRAQDLREKALEDFRNKKCPVLLTTDVCSRGIDVKELDVVINYDMPKDLSSYVHRVGRTGRIRNGTCISFVSPEGDRPLLEDIKKSCQECGQLVPETLTDILDGPNGFRHHDPNKNGNQTATVGTDESKEKEDVEEPNSNNDDLTKSTAEESTDQNVSEGV